MPPYEQLHIDRYSQGSDIWIALEGELDMHSAWMFTDEHAEALGPDTAAIHVDLSALRFCDCSGLRALMLAARSTRASGRTFRAHAPSPAVLRLLDVTRTDTALLSQETDAGTSEAA